MKAGVLYLVPFPSLPFRFRVSSRTLTTVGQPYPTYTLLTSHGSSSTNMISHHSAVALPSPVVHHTHPLSEFFSHLYSVALEEQVVYSL